MFARLICWWKGHARFKLAKDVTNEDPRVRPLRCPRCKAVKWVKVPEKKQAALALVTKPDDSPNATRFEGQAA